MSLNFCDLLVLGSDLSGVMTATLLAKRGMNVLILDDEAEDEAGPNVAMGLASRGFRSLMGKLMIPDARLQILHENRVSCQVVFPRHRLDLHTSRPLFFKEVEREFPGEKPLLEELLAEIDRLRENYLDEILSFFPVVGPKEKKRFIRWYRNFPEEKAGALWERLSPTMRSVIETQLRFLTQSPTVDPLILQILLFLPPEEGTTFSIRGGMREIKKLFFGRLDYFGGMVHPLGNDPFQILTKGREVRAVQLARYSFPTRCRFLLGNMNIQSLYRCLPSPFLPFLFGRTRKRVLALEPHEERRFVQYHTSREVLPAPMKENLIFVTDPTAPLSGTNYLEINLNPKPSSNGCDTVLTVSYRTPGHAAGEDLATADEIDRKIRRLIPFANSHLRRTFPEPKSPKPADEPDLFPETPGKENPPSGKIAYSPSLFFPTMNSPFRNLFAVGPNILDWLGMHGKMLAALRAIDLIWTRELKVRNP